MKVLRFPILFLFAVLLIVQSCSKDDEFDTTTTDQNDTPEPKSVTDENSLLKRANADNNDQGELLGLECISIQFPFEVVDEDGNTYSVNGLVDFENLIYDTSGVAVIVDFYYPIIAINESGETVTIGSAEELGELFASCIPDIAWREEDFPAFLIDNVTSCFALDYDELYVQDEDGNEIKIDDEDDFIEIITEQFVFFVYPFNLIAEDGTVLPVNSTEELFDALASCNGIYPDNIDFDGDWDLDWDFDEGFGYIACYQLAFPYSVKLTNDSQVSVENHQQLGDLLVQGAIVDYVYPITLTNEEGNAVTVNNFEELNEQIESCYDDYGDDHVDFDTVFFTLLTLVYETYDLEGNAQCLDIQFPINLVMTDDSGAVQTQVVESREDFIILTETSFFNVSVELPITATRISDQEVLTIEDAKTLIKELENCFGR